MIVDKVRVAYYFFMKKSKIFSIVMELVANELEISKEAILSKKKSAEVVDARHLLVVLLSRYGFYTQTIADILKCTPRSIQHILAYFDERIKYCPPLRFAYQRVQKKLQEIFANESVI